jgi:hypothetical protein
VPILAGPNWLGSPQHVVAGAVLALAVVVVVRWVGLRGSVAVALAIGAASTAEIVVELVEYPLLYADTFHHSVYYDTLSDMASTLAGGIAGAALGCLAMRGRDRRLR